MNINQYEVVALSDLELDEADGGLIVVGVTFLGVVAAAFIGGLMFGNALANQEHDASIDNANSQGDCACCIGEDGMCLSNHE